MLSMRRLAPIPLQRPPAIRQGMQDFMHRNGVDSRLIVIDTVSRALNG
jgi:hypothetical protein